MRVALIFSGFGALAIGAVLYFGAYPLPSGSDLAAALARVTSRAAAPTESPDRPAPPPVPVQVATVQRAAVPIFLTGIGMVQAYNSVAVKSRVDGEIVQVLFQEGQDVKQGDPLVIIDKRPYQAQLDQQMATLKKDQAMLEGAILDMHRYDALVLKDFASRQQVDQQHALVDQYRAQINTDQAQIDYAQTLVNYTTIRALIGGRVGIRLIDQGNFIHATDTTPIVVITQLQPISVVFTIAAAALETTKLTLGRVNAPVVAIGQDDRTELDHGTLDMVDNQVDQSTGTIKLKASFPNEKLKLWPGNFVNGRITVDTRADGLTIPAAALRHGPRGDFVWIVKPDDTVATRNVTAGQVAAGRVLVERGLTHGDTVVTEGYFRLEDGSKVAIQKPPAAKQAATTD